jgi:hypothetical protein
MKYYAGMDVSLEGTSKNVAISLRFGRIVGVGGMNEDF